MRYNPIPKTDEDLADYRGSIVHLTPATTYEIELTLAGTSTTAEPDGHDLERAVPGGRNDPRGQPRTRRSEITESGTPKAYGVYDGRGATIDVRHQQDACITINASYVILRGFTLKGAGATNCASQADHRRDSDRGRARHRHRGLRHFRLGPAQSRDRFWVRLRRGHLFAQLHVEAPHRPALQAAPSHLRRQHLVRAEVSHPHRWVRSASRCSTPRGNHVIRYNECCSDLEHMYNDVIGGGSNGSFRGSPGPDSDIYGNSSATAGTMAWRWKAAAATCGSGTTTSPSA